MPRAVGIPDRDVYGEPLKKLKPGALVDFLIQRHLAEKAGPHYDVRLGNKSLGLFSWATRKELPEPGKQIAFFQQPLHSYSYRTFEGMIPEGYGKGKVKKHLEGSLLITKVKPDSVSFTTGHERYPQRYTLVKPDSDKRWLLINSTPTKPVPYQKQHYKLIDPAKAEEVIKGLQKGETVQPKIDGAASLTVLGKDGIEIVSYRVSKVTDAPIVHTERVLHGRPEMKIPKELVGTILRGELYGVKDGEVIKPQALGGLLNSTLEKSITQQRDKKIQLKNMVFDVHKLGSTNTMHLPYAERKELLAKVLKHLPEDVFHMPEEAKTPKDAFELYEQIRHGEHPLTAEGVVIHYAQGKPAKIKFTDEHDVYITGTFKGDGKWKDKGVGGFTYSLTPKGKTIGKVGTGLSDQLRKDAFKDPSAYTGRVARIRAQEQHPSGAYRAPALLAFHEDYPMKTAMELLAEKIAKKLTSKARDDIPTGEFAEPGKRKYPIENPSHARNALSRVSQFGSSAEKAEVREAVHAKYPSIGEKKAEHSGTSRLAVGLGGSIHPILGGATSVALDEASNPMDRMRGSFETVGGSLLGHAGGDIAGAALARALHLDPALGARLGRKIGGGLGAYAMARPASKPKNDYSIWNGGEGTGYKLSAEKPLESILLKRADESFSGRAQTLIDRQRNPTAGLQAAPAKRQFTMDDLKAGYAAMGKQAPMATARPAVPRLMPVAAPRPAAAPAAGGGLLSKLFRR